MTFRQNPRHFVRASYDARSKSGLGFPCNAQVRICTLSKIKLRGITLGTGLYGGFTLLPLSLLGIT